MAAFETSPAGYFADVRAAKKILTIPLGLLALAAAAPATLAQAPPGTRFGGGAVAERAGSRGPNVGDHVVSAFVSRTGRTLGVLVTPVIRCRSGRTGSASLRGAARIGTDGSFTLRLRGRDPLSPGFTARATLRGTVTADRLAASGTTTARLRGRRVCRDRIAVTGVTARTLPGDAAPPPAGVTLVSPLRTPPPFLPGSLALRVASDGRSVVGVNTQTYSRCGRRSYSDLTIPNLTRAIPIAGDGSFATTERYTIRYSDVNEHVTFTAAGQFVTGGAVGAVRFRSVVRRRGSRGIVTRCDTGDASFAAVA